MDICKITKKINSNGKRKYTEQSKPLWTMEEKVRKMIDHVMDAYNDIDEVRAYEICKSDDEIDSLYRVIFNNILKEVEKDESKANTSAQLLFVAKYLERIADHVTNICEWIIFLKTGKYVDLND